MSLIPNWREIALRAHSMWAIYLGILCLWLPELIYWVLERDSNPVIWWVLANILLVYGAVGRLKDQGISSLLIAFLAMASLGSQSSAQATERATMRIAVPLVMHWEGEHRCKDNPAMHCAYLDRIAQPPLWTACYGETLNIRGGDRFSDRECRSMLEARLANDFRAGLHEYFTDETKALRLTPERDAAYVSLSYNVGKRGAGRSTATRRLNAGDIAGGCKALTWWNKAGGRVIRGLVRRRAAEYELCMRGLV